MLLRAPIAAPASALIEIYHLGDISELPEQWLKPRVIAAARSAMQQQHGWNLAHLSAVRPQRFAINVKEETHVVAANSHKFIVYGGTFIAEKRPLWKSQTSLSILHA